MTPEQAHLLRRLALNDKAAVNEVMGESRTVGLDPRTRALLTVAVLLGIGSDSEAFRSAVEDGIAAGVDDDDFVDALIAVAPIVGTARLSSSLPHLMSALDVEVIED